MRYSSIYFATIYVIFYYNKLTEEFLKLAETEDGQHSIEAVDYVFEASERANLDSRGKRLLLSDGQKLTIDERVEKIY